MGDHVQEDFGMILANKQAFPGSLASGAASGMSLRQPLKQIDYTRGRDIAIAKVRAALAAHQPSAEAKA
jgi:hypothetical protein